MQDNINDIITTLHPQGDTTTNIYPNILPDNIPINGVDATKLNINQNISLQLPQNATININDYEGKTVYLDYQSISDTQETLIHLTSNKPTIFICGEGIKNPLLDSILTSLNSSNNYAIIKISEIPSNTGINIYVAVNSAFCIIQLDYEF